MDATLYEPTPRGVNESARRRRSTNTNVRCGQMRLSVSHLPSSFAPAPSDTMAVAALVDELRASLSAEATVTASATAKLLYARDSWPRLSLQARAGQRAISPPDLVVHAGTVADVVEVVRAAGRHSLPVVPFGAGSGVCGAAVPLKGGISLDTKRLLDLDLSRAADGLICVGAGWIGQRLEHELQRHGYTLGHFPSSIGCSTIGGYLATRSAGQYSTRFGKIEDMVVSLRFVDGEGQLRHTTEGAIDTTQLLVGSEGMLGVIVDAWLRVEPAATAGRLFRGYWCASVSQGLEAMRKALQAGHQPAVFRLYDPFDSFISGARKAEEGELLLPTDPQQWPRKRAPSWLPASLSPAELKPRLMTAANELLSRRPSATHWLNHLASKAETGCLLIAGVEEANADDANLLGQALFDDLASSLQDLGPAPGQYWFAHRHDVSFKMAPILASGMFVDTMEVSAPWHRVAALYDAVHESVEKEAFVMAHFSHAYTSGCSIYFTFAGFGADESDCLARYDRVWKAGLSAVADFGAATTHHHGVGLLKAPWLGHDQPGGAPLFAAARREIDPAGRLNPGKLWEVAQ